MSDEVTCPAARRSVLETEDSTNAVCLTPDTKDSIDKEPLTKIPKSTTPINAARPDRVHEARDAHEVLSARTDFYHLSDVPVRDGRLVKSSPW